MLNVYTLDDRRKWDAIVRSIANYDVYYTSGYVSAFQLIGDGDPCLIYYESATLKGINVVMKRDIALSEPFKGKLTENTYYDLSTPYGYGGWILDGDMSACATLFAEYEQWCIRNNIISEFVRFHPVLENSRFSEGYYQVVLLGETVTLDLSDPDTIWDNFSSKNRNMIRKAEKSGVQIFNGRSPALFDEFMEIYNQTMERDAADDYYFFDRKFYESICFDLPEQAQLFYAVKDGRMIAASIILAADGKLHYHLSGSLAEYRSYAPTNLLLYKAALWGCANGCTSFHLGGGVGSREDNLFKFKKSFFRGDELTRFAIGKKIFNQEEYDRLVSMREVGESGFFPKYRA